MCAPEDACPPRQLSILNVASNFEKSAESIPFGCIFRPCPSLAAIGASDFVGSLPIGAEVLWLVRMVARHGQMYIAREHAHISLGAHDANATGPHHAFDRIGARIVKRSLILVAVVLLLVATVLPSAAADTTTPQPDPANAPVETGDLVGEAGIIEPDCDDPPCEPTEILSAGSGGFIPIDPVRVAELEALGTAPADIAIVGAAAVPEEGVGAVVLNLVVTDSKQRSSVTVWPTGTSRPDEPNLIVDKTRTWTTVALAQLGDDGNVSVHNERGRIDLDVDVIGWFPADSEMILVGPERVFDSSSNRPRKKLRPGSTTDVAVAGSAGVPSEGAAAVVINLTASSSTTSSGLTVWPVGEPRPVAPHLITEAARPRSNLAIVPLGDGGAVSIYNDAGLTHAAVDVLGWIPADSAYRPVSPVAVFDAEADRGSPIGTGEIIDITVTGVAGVPEVGADPELGSPHTVVLNLSTDPPVSDAAMTVYPTGDDPPATINLAGGWHNTATVTLALVQVGKDGQVSLFNRGAPAGLRVDVVGWFANPIAAAELAVPESTVAPEEAAVESVEDGTVVLAPGSEPVVSGDHVVLGVTDDTPEGYLGAVTKVTTEEDGTQRIETTEAYLEDVFPEGDITFDLEPEDYDVVGLNARNLADGSLSIAGTAMTAEGMRMDVTLQGEGEAAACDASGVDAYLKPIFSARMSLKWRWFKSPLITALATVGAEAGMSLEKVSATCGWEFDLFKTVVTIWVGPVPIVLVNEGTLSIDLEAGLDGLDLAATASAGVTVGVRYNRFPYMKGFADFEYTPITEALLQARDLKAYAMLDIWLNIEVRLYGIVGPQISFGPFLETFLTTNPAEPWWAMDLGMAAKVGLLVKLWFKSWNFGEWEGEIPVAKWVGMPLCSPYGPGAGDGYEGVCRTPVPAKRANGDVRDGFAGRFRVASSGRPLAQLAIAPITLPDGEVGELYPEQRLHATGLFSDTVAWHIVKGEIPGMTLGQNTGVLSGTPTTPGAFSMTVEAWYGPVPDGATTPPYGPTPPPQIELTMTVEGDCALSAAVTDAGDDGRTGQLRHAIATVCDGGTISVPSGMDIVLTQGELVVPAGKTVTITGDHSDEEFTIDADAKSRVLAVEETADLTLNHATLRNGRTLFGQSGAGISNAGTATLLSSSVLDSSAGTLWAGGIDNSGTLVVVDSVIADNDSSGGGGIRSSGTAEIRDSQILRNSGSSKRAGGISNSGTMTVAGTVIADNGAFYGGGIVNDGTMTIADSAIRGSSGYQGAGIHNSGSLRIEGTTTITGSTGRYGGGFYNTGTVIMTDTVAVSGNVMESGAGFTNSASGVVEMYNQSTVSGNTATASVPYFDYIRGGGVDNNGTLRLFDSSSIIGNNSDNLGGGIHNGGTVTLSGTTSVTNNTATVLGGGIYNSGGTVTVSVGSTVSENTPDDIYTP